MYDGAHGGKLFFRHVTESHVVIDVICKQNEP